MAKTCKCGCGWSVFSHGYAKNCQHKRTDDKKPKKPAFRTRKERAKNLSFGYEDQVTMFRDLWEKARNKQGRVICPFTNLDITDLEGTSMFFSCCAHILPKGRFPYFKLNPENIAIVAPLFHQLVDNGTARQREMHPTWKWSLWYEKVAEMKEKYVQYKRDNMLP